MNKVYVELKRSWTSNTPDYFFAHLTFERKEGTNEVRMIRDGNKIIYDGPIEHIGVLAGEVIKSLVMEALSK